MTTMTTVAAGTWTVDLAHTRAEFAARHLCGSTVHGTIAVTAGTIEVGAAGRPVRLHATLDPASIDTGNARRDADLRGKRFLAVDAYPQMEFAAARIAATVRGWHVDAVLCGHGREAPVRIDATLEGAATAPPPAGERHGATGSARRRHPGARIPGAPVRRPVSFRAAHTANVSMRMTSESSESCWPRPCRSTPTGPPWSAARRVPRCRGSPNSARRRQSPAVRWSAPPPLRPPTRTSWPAARAPGMAHQFAPRPLIVLVNR